MDARTEAELLEAIAVQRKIRDEAAAVDDTKAVLAARAEIGRLSHELRKLRMEASRP